MAVIHLLLKIVNLKILEYSQEYVYSEVIMQSYIYWIFRQRFLFLNIFSINTVPSQSTLISHEVFHDCQVSLENNTNLTTAFKGDVFKIFGKVGEPYMEGGT